MKISVVICTYNRCSLLEGAIASLLEQSFAGEEYEVLVVDNNSTDGTREVVLRAQATGRDVRYLHEPEQGLSAARNRGIREARGEIIAFVDDDARADTKWLEQLYEGFSDERTACAGGKVDPLWDALSGWPDWVPPQLIGFYTVVDYGGRSYLQYPDYPAGTNIAFRKSVFSDVGTFSPTLGRTGTSLLSMEEADLCRRIEQAGYRIRYLPGAVVHHLVPEQRLTRAWLKERAEWQGVSAAILEKQRFSRMSIVGKCLKYLAFIAGGGAGALLFRLFRDEKRRFFCDCQVRLCLSYLRALARQK